MATKRVIPDTDFRQIIIRTRITARNISMRTKVDGLHVTVPPYCPTSKIMSVVEEFRPRLLEKWEKVTPQPLNLNFRIDTPCFQLHLEQGRFSHSPHRRRRHYYLLPTPCRLFPEIHTRLVTQRHHSCVKEECAKLSSTIVGRVGYTLQFQI